MGNGYAIECNRPADCGDDSAIPPGIGQQRSRLPQQQQQQQGWLPSQDIRDPVNPPLPNARSSHSAVHSARPAPNATGWGGGGTGPYTQTSQPQSVGGLARQSLPHSPWPATAPTVLQQQPAVGASGSAATTTHRHPTPPAVTGRATATATSTVASGPTQLSQTTRTAITQSGPWSDLCHAMGMRATDKPVWKPIIIDGCHTGATCGRVMTQRSANAWVCRINNLGIRPKPVDAVNDPDAFVSLGGKGNIIHVIDAARVHIDATNAVVSAVYETQNPPEALTRYRIAIHQEPGPIVGPVDRTAAMNAVELRNCFAGLGIPAPARIPRLPYDAVKHAWECSRKYHHPYVQVIENYLRTISPPA